MVELLHRARQWWTGVVGDIRSWLGWSALVEVPVGHLPAPVVRQPESVYIPEPVSRRRFRRPRKSRVVPSAEAHSARWHFKGAILDHLDEYFTCIQHLKKWDRSVYSMFRRIGFVLTSDHEGVPYVSDFSECTVGGILCGGWSDTPESLKCGDVYPSFIFFEKIDSPIAVEAVSSGIVFRIGMLYDDRKATSAWKSKFNALMTMFVCVDGEEIRVLRELRTKRHKFTVRPSGQKRNGRQFKGHRFEMCKTAREWIIPEWAREVSQRHDRSVDEWATANLHYTVSAWRSATEKIVVRASRGDVTAAFGVDVSRCKYFFRDRGHEALAVDGKRKRIFHSVVEHDRTLRTGRVVKVKSHYRGIRKFTWNRSDITIVLPANTDLYKGPTMPAKEFERLPSPQKDWVTYGRYGKLIARLASE